MITHHSRQHMESSVPHELTEIKATNWKESEISKIRLRFSIQVLTSFYISAAEVQHSIQMKAGFYIYIYISAAEVQHSSEGKLPRVVIVAIGKFNQFYICICYTKCIKYLAFVILLYIQNAL